MGGGPDSAELPQPDEDGIVELSGYVINDAATDNTERLLALRDMLHERRDRALTLRFPPEGEVHYIDNRWLWGAGDVTIEGNGTGFRCTLDTAWTADARPFNVKTPFNVLGPVSRAEENRQGNPFTVGELWSEADLARYEGQRVLVYGYDTQQGGFPPNPRHFHYTSVISGALVDPLPFEPDDRWPDFEQFTGPIGRPRILSLDRPDYFYPRRIVFKNCRFAGGFVVIEAEHLEFEDCESEYFGVSINRTARFTRTRAPRWEHDKIVERVDMDACEAPLGFGEATGVRALSCRNCTFGGDCRPRGPDMEFLNCTFVGGAGHQHGIWRYIDRWAVRRLYFRGCTFDATESPDLRYAINPGADDTQPALLPMIEVTEVLPDAVAVRAVGRWEGRDVHLWGNMLAEQPLLDAVGIPWGLVEGLHSDAGGRVLVRATWNQPPQVGAVYAMWLIFGRFDGGGNKVMGRDVPLWRGKFESVQEQSPPGERPSMIGASADWGLTA
jgi:hypothetical protein